MLDDLLEEIVNLKHNFREQFDFKFKRGTKCKYVDKKGAVIKNQEGKPIHAPTPSTSKGFFNEENKRDYTPAYWLKKGETIDPNEDGLFYDIYMESFESLLIGNYSESDYRKLYKYLTEWDKWGKINKGNAQETRAFVEECLNDVEIQVEDGEECLITRYNFSKDKNSMMNLDNLNALHDNIFKETDYIGTLNC